jgi:ATP-binding cassette, subfamily F, member 3
MSLITTNNLSKFYGPDEIFSGISLAIPHKSRIALVGSNGTGKTTLLNILVGLDIPTNGEVIKARNLRIGFLPQRPVLEGEHTLWKEALQAFVHVQEMQDELTHLEETMADPDHDDTVMNTYGKLQERFELAGGYTYESRIRMVLRGVGFEESEFQMPLTKLSGGQVTRALLARLLLDEPDVLILDEPTNHLDINAIEWLERFLREFPGAVLAVSHDRYFMDVFAKVTWELEYGMMEVYRGNYSHYIQQRTERHERLLKDYQSQQEFLAKEEDYIRRNMAGQNTNQAKGRLKRLETMKKRGRIISRPRSKLRPMKLRMKAAMRSGNKVLMTKKLSVGYEDGDGPLFHVPDITLWRGETAALIGPNGVGKTTFLKTIIQQLEPLSGESKIGASVRLGYFAQAHERLNPENTLLEEVWEVKQMPVSETRNYLALFLFTGDDVYRKVATLSGGERGRLALSKLSLAGANVLLLDEPTNHLDIDSQEVLQGVLENFNGTILMVSHDRYLIDALATQIWAANPGDLAVFKGNYREFVAERNKRVEAEKQVAFETGKGKRNSKLNQTENQSGTKIKKHGLNPFQLKRRIAEVEARIENLETRLQEVTAAIEISSAAGDGDRIRDLGVEYAQLETDLHTTMDEWGLLAE